MLEPRIFYFLPQNKFLKSGTPENQKRGHFTYSGLKGQAFKGKFCPETPMNTNRLLFV